MSTFFLSKKNHAYAFERREVDEKLASVCEESRSENIKSGPNMEIEGIPIILFVMLCLTKVCKGVIRAANGESESVTGKLSYRAI